MKLSREHLKNFFTAITGQVLLIQATGSPFKLDDEQKESFDWIANLTIVAMDGSHHLHMEEQAEQVAAVVQAFIQPLPLF